MLNLVALYGELGQLAHFYDCVVKSNSIMLTLLAGLCSQCSACCFTLYTSAWQSMLHNNAVNSRSSRAIYMYAYQCNVLLTGSGNL